MEKVSFSENLLEQLFRVSTFRDNGDVDLDHFVACVDDYGKIAAAIVVGNTTNHPTLGKSIPKTIYDKQGSAQILYLYTEDPTSFGLLNELLSDFLANLLPGKILWSYVSEYTRSCIMQIRLLASY